MTKIIIYLDGLHENTGINITKFDFRAVYVEGHTKKEVCNGISALIWTLASALDNYVGESVKIADEEGKMSVDLVKRIDDQTNLIFETIVCGLNQIYENNKEHMYPIEYKIPATEDGEETDDRTDEDTE